MKRNSETDSSKKPYVVVIILLILTAIIVAFIVVFVIKNNNDPSKKPIGDRRIIAKPNGGSFFAIQNMVNSFVSYGSSKVVYNLLYEDYVLSNGINENNAISVARMNLSSLSFRQQKFSNINLNDINKNIYIVNGILVKTIMDEEEIIDSDYSVILLIDYDTSSFSIIPNTKEVPEYILSKKSFTISENDYNRIPASGVKNRYDYCEAYYNDFVFKVNYLTDEAMKLLYDENDISESKLKAKFNNNSIVKSCKYDSEINTYVIVDSNNNELSIKEYEVMNYKVDLQ